MKTIYLILLLLVFQQSNALDNGLASVPPMGWSTWNLFWCNVDCKSQPNLCVNEENIKQIADSLVSSGLSDLGYKFVNVDDCYLAQNRDNVTNKLVPNSQNFPSGMKSLGDYIHSKGLKYGMYEDVGSLTCGGYPGSKDHFALDIQTFKEWGVDYLKMDGCYVTNNTFQSDYTTISNEITKQSANIIFECSWPAYVMQADDFDWYYLSSICHTWRTYGHDIRDNWGSVKGIIQYWATQDIAKYSGPGSYNMADFITVGQGGMTKEEYRTQFTLWSMWSSPLMLSIDVRNLTTDILEIVANKEVINYVSQDPLAKQAVKVQTINGSVDIWVKQLRAPHSFAVALVNMDDKQNLEVTLNLSQILQNVQINQGYNVRDLWEFKDLSQNVTLFTSKLLQPHSSQLLKIDITQKVQQQKQIQQISYLKNKEVSNYQFDPQNAYQITNSLQFYSTMNCNLTIPQQNNVTLQCQMLQGSGYINQINIQSNQATNIVVNNNNQNQLIISMGANSILQVVNTGNETITALCQKSSNFDIQQREIIQIDQQIINRFLQ